MNILTSSTYTNNTHIQPDIINVMDRAYATILRDYAIKKIKTIESRKNISNLFSKNTNILYR